MNNWKAWLMVGSCAVVFVWWTRRLFEWLQSDRMSLWQAGFLALWLIAAACGLNCCSAHAETLRIHNWTSNKVDIARGAAEYVAPQGNSEYAWRDGATDELSVSGITIAEAIIPRREYDVYLSEAPSGVVSVNTVESYGPLESFSLGMIAGFAWFGFNLVLRIVRTIVHPTPEV